MAGLLVFSRLVVDLRAGVTSSNWGTWRRDDSRLRFQCNVYVWGAITVLCFVVGILTMLGYVSLPSPGMSR